MAKKQLSQLPSIDEVLNDQRLFVFLQNTPRNVVLEAAREVIGEEREYLLSSGEEREVSDKKIIIEKIMRRIRQKKRHSLTKAINATGVVLHTNLGRARLSEVVCKNIVRIAQGYATLEYDVKKGARGSRHDHVERLITKITGAEAAMVVNNNAAATMLCLSAMAEGSKVIVSRGELVEIGGSFRIPEIMEQSGAKLVEIGTTNKTRLEDYEEAIDQETAALMKVHTSNYRIVGFSAETSLEELVSLGEKKDLPVIYDMGSGLLADLENYGIHEPTVVKSLKTGIDVILFSGDKLLGGPQAGILAGKKEQIDKMKKHPLARVLRIDKMTLAALEETFRIYLDLEKAKSQIPVLQMLTISPEILKVRAQNLADALNSCDGCEAEVMPVQGQVGGGSAPTVLLEGWATALKGPLPAEKMERLLRNRELPVICRIIKERIYFDVRTIWRDEEEEIVNAVKEAVNSLTGGKKA